MGDVFFNRTGFVFLTNRRDLAATYARQAGGVVYRVRPIGGLDICAQALRRWRLVCEVTGQKFRPNLVAEFTCPRAEVLEVAR